MLEEREYNNLQSSLSALIKKDPLRSEQYEKGILAAKSIVSSVHKYSGKTLQDSEEVKEMVLRLREKKFKPVPSDLPQRQQHKDRYINALADALSVVKKFEDKILQREMPMESRIKNPENEKNFIIQPLENGFVVRSDSERFGMNEIVFQGINYKECLNYISKRTENREPTYYVIKDLSSWRSDIRELYKLENSGIERFDMLDEAIHRFNEYKRQDYLKQEIVDPETGNPMRRLALGVSCIGEMDLLHTEGEKTLLISDIVAERKHGYETFMTNEKFIRDLNRIVKEIPIDEYSYYRPLTIEELAEQRLHLMQTDSPELEYTMEDAMRFAHYYVSKHPHYLSNCKVNERIPFAEFSAPYLYEEPKKITLHIKYKEPKNINGFKVEEDTIEFGSLCELKQYLRGEVTYDVMDNTVRKREDEVPVSANDEEGKIVWQAGKGRVAAHNKH